MRRYAIILPHKTITTGDWGEVERLRLIYPTAPFFKDLKEHDYIKIADVDKRIAFALSQIKICEKNKVFSHIKIGITDINSVTITRYELCNVDTDLMLHKYYKSSEYTKFENTYLVCSETLMSSNRQFRMALAAIEALNIVGDYIDVLFCFENISMLLCCKYKGNNPILSELSDKVSSRIGGVFFDILRLQHVKELDNE